MRCHRRRISDTRTMSYLFGGFEQLVLDEPFALFSSWSPFFILNVSLKSIENRWPPCALNVIWPVTLHEIITSPRGRRVGKPTCRGGAALKWFYYRDNQGNPTFALPLSAGSSRRKVFWEPARCLCSTLGRGQCFKEGAASDCGV